MIRILDKALVTLYVDGVAIFLLLGLLAMFRNYRVRMDKFSNMLFERMCILIVCNAVLAMAYYTCRYQDPGWPPIVRNLLPSLDELSATYVLLFWVLYADYNIYGSISRLRALHWSFAAPVLFVTFFTVINPFTGIMFTVDELMLLHFKPMFYVIEVVEFVYGFMPVFIVRHYTKKYGKLHFFSVMPVIIPVCIASLFSLSTDYSARALGFAVGMVLLFLSYETKWRYDDAESGLYNHHYVEYIIDLAESGKRDYQSAVTFRAANATKDFFKLLRTELPKEGELIRINKDTVLVLTESDKASMLSLLADLVQEAAEEYDEKHPEERAMDIITSVRKRKKNEAAPAFVKRVCAA